MRSSAAVFFDQSAPLLDPEALLLVDDRQRQARNPRALLKQRVRADDDAGFALHNPRLRRPPNACRLRSGENLTTAAERLQQSGKGLQVLRREYLRRRHQRGGEARLRRRRASQKSDDGFAAADIAVQQAAHLASARQIGEYLVARARLPAVKANGNAASIPSAHAPRAIIGAAPARARFCRIAICVANASSKASRRRAAFCPRASVSSSSPAG